jgi:Fe-S cluster assembly ATP-binding protein
MTDVLEIKNLHARVPEKEILKGVNLTIKTGEVHAIMGPNGTGKSTLSSIIMGNPKYEITEGEILFNGKDIKTLPVDERARLGIFLAYQQPIEVPGVTNSDFIRQAMKACGSDLSLSKFIKAYDSACKDLEMPEGLAQRNLNQGFSGGEMKRNEILQMKLLKPKFAILDEIDSGLDVDALRIVGNNVENEVKAEGSHLGCLLITHYQRLLDYIKPDFVHVMINGRVVKTGGHELIEKIDQEGYRWVKKELGIDIEKEAEVHILGTCARAK